jgi:protein Mpv17
MIFRWLSRYDTLLHSRPVTTKVATATLLSALNDVVLQRYATSSTATHHDAKRTVRQAFWSGPLMATTLHFWMELLARLPARGPLPAPIVCLAVDSFTLMPLSHVAFVAYISATMHGSFEHVAADAREKLGPLLRAGYCVIPPTMLVNLLIVPLRFRVLFLNVTLGVGYGAFLNFRVNKAPESRMPPRRDSSSYS